MTDLQVRFFDRVTLLITHYNRPASLFRLVAHFLELKIQFAEIIVSDDGSTEANISLLKDFCREQNITLLVSKTNRGLGNNMNKGQMAVKTPYTLYVQEDFIPFQLFREKFEVALSLMEEDKSIDMARFYAYFRYPSLKPLRDGFGLMVFKPYSFFSSYKKFYAYSDHPHLRKSSFLTKFGPYAEGISGDKTEYKMMMSFLKKKGKSIFYYDQQALFEQCNTDNEPSTMTRNKLRTTSNPLVSIIRHFYRHIKFNLDYFI